jgi:hypothetical protein
MPQNLRNFWISGDVDGTASGIRGTGPRSKDGGFTLKVEMRSGGKGFDALTIAGTVDPDGKLWLHVKDHNGDTVHDIVTER